MSAFMNLPRIEGCLAGSKTARGGEKFWVSLSKQTGAERSKAGRLKGWKAERSGRHRHTQELSAFKPSSLLRRSEQPYPPENTGAEDTGGGDGQDPGPDDLAGHAPAVGRKPPRGPDADDRAG